MSKRRVVHVVPNKKGGWDVKKQGEPNPVSHHRLKERAVESGRKVAKDSYSGQLKIHKQDGRIQAEHTYGGEIAKRSTVRKKKIWGGTDNTGPELK